MYSLVLMSALATTPDTAQFNGYFRDLFSFRGSCSGCTGCTGCTGCHGTDDSFGWRVRSLFSLGGGCGGSCHGSCHGSSCHGSCSGSCTGRSANANSCYGSSCMGSSASCFGSQSYSCIGSGMIYSDLPMMGNGPIINGPIIGNPQLGFGEQRAPTRPAPVIEESNYGRNPLLPDPKNLNRDPSRAIVTVKAPADGSIFCDGQPVKLSNGERTFLTPSLPTGQKFEYTFRLEYTKDGERRSRERIIQVRAGGTTVCDFNDDSTSLLPAPISPLTSEPKLATKMIPSADPMSAKSPGLFPISAQIPAKAEVKSIQASTPERAKFSIRLPAEAVLYVDGQKTSKMGAVREFTTPVLPVGKEFKYEIKVEIPGPHGYPQTINTTVSFKAGESVPELNFDELLKK